MGKNIQVLYELKNQLENWKKHDESSLKKIIADFEKIPREEFSNYYVPIFTDDSLAEILIEIGKSFCANPSILVNIVSSVGNMVWRYKLIPSKKVFNFFVEVSKNKKVNYYVSLYISSFPQFHIWNEKWKYLISIPVIAPKKKSIINFHTEITKIIKAGEKIPPNSLNEIISILESYVKSDLISEYTKKEFMDCIICISNMNT